jgi:hypothetical protein
VTAEAVRRTLSLAADGRPLDVRVTPLADVVTGRLRTVARAGVGVAVVLLLLCAANMASLWTTRCVYRLGAIATRRVIGASGWHIARLLAAEYLLVSVAVCVLAVGVASVVLAFAANVAPPEYAALGQPRLTVRVAVAILAVGALLVGLAMAPSAGLVYKMIQTPRLHDASTRMGRARRRQLTFVAMQASLAMVLVIGSGTLVRSTTALFRQSTGYARDALFVPVVYGVVVPGGSQIRDGIERLRRLPGVVGAAATTGFVTTTTGMSIGTVTVAGEAVSVDRAEVTADYFNVTGMHLWRGRLLGPADADHHTAVVDRAFAESFWPGEDPIGRVLLAGRTGIEVVGVVDSILGRGLAAPARPTVFLFLDRWPAPFLMVTYVAKVDGEPTRYAGLITRVLADASPTARVGTATTIGARLADSVRERTFATLVLTLFGVTGAFVCLTGTAAVVSFAVARRRRELAIRLALGSTVAQVRNLVVSDAVSAACVGGVAGVLAGRWLATGLQSFVYGAEAGAWTTALVGAAGLLAATVVSAGIPSRRVRDVSPADALRLE